MANELPVYQSPQEAFGGPTTSIDIPYNNYSQYGRMSQSLPNQELNRVAPPYQSQRHSSSNYPAYNNNDPETWNEYNASSFKGRAPSHQGPPSAYAPNGMPIYRQPQQQQQQQRQPRPVQHQSRPVQHPRPVQHQHQSRPGQPQYQARPTRQQNPGAFYPPQSSRTREANPVSPEPSLRALFNDVDSSGDGRLSEYELSRALTNADNTQFNGEIVRLLIKLFDKDGDNHINFEEFNTLWTYLSEWRTYFEKFDRNHNCFISLKEFKNALEAFGFSLSSKCIEFVFLKYSRPGLGEQVMSFDLFVLSCYVLNSIANIFKGIDKDRDGYITIGFEEFLVNVIELK